MKFQKLIAIIVILAVCLLGCKANRDNNYDGDDDRAARCNTENLSSLQEEIDCAAKCNTEKQNSLEEITCEHQIPIIDCDNCRYEVGVVKLASSVAENLIQTGTVEDIESNKVLKLTGQVQIDRTNAVEVVPIGSGQVKQVIKFLGEKVNKGDVLAIITSSDLSQAKAEFLDVQAKLELANSTFKREEELYENKISSQADYLKALNELRSAEASYAAVDKKLRLFGLETEQIAAVKEEKDNGKFADLILRAPQDGMIIAQNISAGNMVEATEILYTIADLSNLWVWCDVYEKDLAAIHDPFNKERSLNAIVKVKAFKASRFDGVVDLVGSLMDEQTRTVKIRVQVKNPEGKLKPGMFAEVDIMIPGQGSVLAVPSNAVMSDDGKHFVFRQFKDDLWIRQDVVIGQSQGSLVEVIDGVSIADRIITGGTFMLKSEVLKEKMGAGCAH